MYVITLFFTTILRHSVKRGRKCSATLCYTTLSNRGPESSATPCNPLLLRHPVFLTGHLCVVDGVSPDLVSDGVVPQHGVQGEG